MEGEGKERENGGCNNGAKETRCKAVLKSGDAVQVKKTICDKTSGKTDSMKV